MLISPTVLGASPDGFYQVSERELYEGLINPQIMSQEQLLDALIDGAKTYHKLFPPPKKPWLRYAIPILILAGGAGAAVAMASTPAAAGGAALAAGESAALSAGAAATTGAASAKAGAVALAQKAAVSMGGSTVIKKAAEHVAARGGDVAEKLSLTAQLYDKYAQPISNAAVGWISSELKQANAVLDDQAQSALREAVEREREKIYRLVEPGERGIAHRDRRCVEIKT